jgi:hypothetical protein
MRAAVVQDLSGHFGPIEADGIWRRVDKYHLDRLYFDIRQIDGHIIAVCAKLGIQAGINIVPNWFNEDLAAAAGRVHFKLNELGFKGAAAGGICPVMFDYEEHSIEKVVAGLKKWRTMRSRRDTCWSMEPLQGGWVGDPQMKSVINGDSNLKLVPQTYRSQMEPVAQDAILRDLFMNYSFKQIQLYYQSFYKQGNQDVYFPIPEAWNGVIYDMEHLSI